MDTRTGDLYPSREAALEAGVQEDSVVEVAGTKKAINGLQRGHAAATGDSGTAFVGFNGKAKASAKGAFAIAWFDSKAERARLIVGTPGENGIKPDVWYRVNEKGQLVETEE